MINFDPTITFLCTLGAYAGYVSYKCLQLKTKTINQAIRIRTLIADKVALEAQILKERIYIP